jgi:hypothetical protein
VLVWHLLNVGLSFIKCCYWNVGLAFIKCGFGIYVSLLLLNVGLLVVSVGLTFAISVD